ncbi:uncharacterized protein LOC120921054 [Rana temporaria]|uniref:uncharacterized protein LOC120921054 n=1 Tax=Rana temporaria TaxID=8407 RepID=UPI001AACEAD3|nr:uncharacterized protein LOC120921054 [Rana temporaria]
MGRSNRKQKAIFAEMRDRTLWLEGLLPTEQAPESCKKHLAALNQAKVKVHAVVPSNTVEMSAQVIASAENPPKFESAVDWCKRHLAALNQNKGEVHAVTLSNAGAGRPAINVQSIKKQVRYLQCSEWGHEVSKCPLSQASTKQRYKKPALNVKSEQMGAVAHSNAYDVRSVDRKTKILPTESPGKFKATLLHGERSLCVSESQQHAARRAPFPLATGEKVSDAVQGAMICASDYMQPMLPAEEVGDFLGKFEKVAVRGKWPRDRWPKFLQTLLPVEYRSVYHLMDSDQDDYCKFKEEILLRGEFHRIMGQRNSSLVDQGSLSDVFSVTPGNKKSSVVSAGGVKQWEMPAVISSCGHQEGFTSEYATERRCPQVKIDLPTSEYGKTVAVSVSSEVCPVRTSAEVLKMDLLQCVTQISGETQGKALLAARSRSEMDIWTMGAPKVVQQNVEGDVLGVTKTVGVSCSLAIETAAAELPRETAKESVLVRQGVSQDNCEAALVGKIVPLERKANVLSRMQGAVRSDKSQSDKGYRTAMFINDDDVVDDTCTYGDVFTSNEVGVIAKQVMRFPLATVGKVAEVSLETSRELCVLEPEVAWDDGRAALMDKRVLDLRDEKNGKTEMSEFACSDVLLQSVAADRKSPHEFNEAPHSGQVMLLQPAVFKNVFAVDTNSAMQNGETAGPVDTGALAFAEVNPLQLEGSEKGAYMAEVLSSAKEMRNVALQNDMVMDSNLESLSVAESERMSVAHAICSAQGKPQVLSVSSEVEVSLNDSASHALANEPLHIVSKGTIPRVLCLDVTCLKITEMLLELVTIFPMYTCVYPQQKGDMVLRSTNRWTQVVQALLSNINENWLLYCWLILCKVVSQFSSRVLPAAVGCGRRSGELLEISEVIDIVEVSPSADVMECIPTGAVRGTAEQWLVHGGRTVSPSRPHEKEGLGMDVAVVGIQSITLREVQFEVPGDTLIGNNGNDICNKVYEKHCRALSDNSELLVEVPMDTEVVKEIGVEKCVLVGQLLLECWTTGGDVKLRDCPIGSNCLPVGGPSIDSVLTNKGTRGPIDNVESGSESGQFLTDPIEVGPQQSQECRSMGGKRGILRPEDRRDRGICKSPWFRKKCWWKHTRKKSWVECPFRGRVRQIKTPAAYSWHKGAMAKCWWKQTRKKWACAANGWPRGDPFVMMGLCVPPSGSKQRGRVCGGLGLSYLNNGRFLPYFGRDKHKLIGQLWFGLFKADLNSIQAPTLQTGGLC